MAIFQLLILTIFAIFASKSQGSLNHLDVPHQIHLLRPQSGAGGSHIPALSCLSWRVGVETNNIIGWKTIPQECEDYVGHYMLGHQYRKDSKFVVDEALLHAQSFNLSNDGKDLWVFDVDETALSNLPYYAENGFGVEPYNATKFAEWVNKGKAPALPESLELYKKLLAMGIKIAFLTGGTQDQRNVTATNLKNAGYFKWEKLILQNSTTYSGKTAVEYKSSERKKLEQNAYKIIGNIGDQWSDLLGTHVGNRTFKLPDPMYYIS